MGKKIGSPKLPYSRYYKTVCIYLWYFFPYFRKGKPFHKHHKKTFWCVFYSRGSSIRERLILARIWNASSWMHFSRDYCKINSRKLNKNCSINALLYFKLKTLAMNPEGYQLTRCTLGTRVIRVVEFLGVVIQWI